MVLAENEYLITCDIDDSITDIYTAALTQGLTCTFKNHTLHPAQTWVDVNASTFANSMSGENAGTLIVPDAVVDDCQLPLSVSTLMLNYAPGVTDEDINRALDKNSFQKELSNPNTTHAIMHGIDMTRSRTLKAGRTANGIISYLSIYIGFVLVIACAAILAIQQLSAAADASGRYHVLSELGTDTSMLHHSLFIQQILFFLLPLGVALAHSGMALSVVIFIIKTKGHLSIGSDTWITIALFIDGYGGYFIVTYLMGAGIICDATRTRSHT